MKYIKIDQESVITLRGKGNNAQEALKEAVWFLVKNELKECDLLYNDYLFSIESDIDIDAKLKHYEYSKSLKK